MLVLAPDQSLCAQLMRYFDNLGCGWFVHILEHDKERYLKLAHVANASRAGGGASAAGGPDLEQLIYLPTYHPRHDKDALLYGKYLVAALTLRLGMGYNIMVMDGDT